MFVAIFIGVENHVLYAQVEISDSLIEAIAFVESGNNHVALGEDGELGIMQISKAVLDEYNQFNPRLDYVDLLDPSKCKKVGRWYLERLRDHYGCKDLDTMLAAYNMGPRARFIKNWSSGVKAYVQKVKRELRLNQVSEMFR